MIHSLYNALNSRVLQLENEFKKLNLSAGGNTAFLKGEPGDISEATAAATKQMGQELQKNREALQAIGAELRKLHSEFQEQFRHDADQFRQSVLTELRQSIQQFVRSFLIEAHVLDETGTKAHPDLRGETGATGSTGATGAVGPQGSVGSAGATGATGLAGRDGVDSKVVGPRGARGAAWWNSYHDEQTAIQAIVDKAVDKVIAALEQQGWLYDEQRTT